MKEAKSITVWRLYTTSDGCGYGRGESTSMVLHSKEAAIQKMQSLPGVCMGVEEPLKDGDQPTCNGYRAEPVDWDEAVVMRCITDCEEQLTQYKLMLQAIRQ